MPPVSPSRRHVLCIIPARMGSTRIKHKNLREIESSVSLIRQAYDIADEFFSCISTDQPALLPDDLKKSFIVKRPLEISDAVSNVSFAISHALVKAEEYYDLEFDFVVTLMPAIAARSRHILKTMLEFLEGDDHIESAMTCAHTHPWIWKVRRGSRTAANTWHPNPQRNSQDLPEYLVEHASIIINRRNIVLSGKKWELPLLIYSLPSWATALDIDIERDLEHAKVLYPAMKPLLDTWRGECYLIDGCSSIIPDA